MKEERKPGRLSYRIRKPFELKIELAKILTKRCTAHVMREIPVSSAD